MLKQRRPLPLAAAIAARAPATMAAAPVKDHLAIAEWVRDNSFVGKVIGSGREYWDHMTQHVAPGLVIDARDSAMTIKDRDLQSGTYVDERWLRVREGWRIPAGVQVRPVSYLLANPNSIKVGIPCTAAAHADFLNALRSQLGERYDKPGIWAIAEGKLTDPDWRGKHHPFFCDALGIWAARTSRLINPLMIPPFQRGPGASLDVWQATEGSRVLSARGNIPRNFLKMAGFDTATIPSA